MPLDVWIDTDAAIGMPERDVDDGLALIQAFHSPEITVRAVSAVFGNAPLADTFPITTEIVRRFGPPGLVVYAGAATAGERGAESDAVRALAAELGVRPLVVLALGPVTNVASLLVRHPELAPRIGGVVCVAGRRPGQCFQSTPRQPEPFPDLNFELDPAAMQILLDAAVDLVFAPWEVSSQVWITRGDLEDLARGGASGTYIAARSQAWLAMWEERFAAPGFNPFDMLAVAWATHPHFLSHDAVHVRIEPAGRAGVAPELVVRPVEAAGGGRPARYCVCPDPELKAILLTRLAGPPRR